MAKAKKVAKLVSPQDATSQMKIAVSTVNRITESQERLTAWMPLLFDAIAKGKTEDVASLANVIASEAEALEQFAHGLGVVASKIYQEGK